MSGLLKRARMLSRDLLGSSDDEHGGANRQKRPKGKTVVNPLPDGPSCFEDVFFWPEDVTRRILQVRRLRHVRTEVKRIKVHLTSSYSGAGFGEAGIQKIAASFRRLTLFDVEVVSHSQTEINEECQKVLEGEHLFRNLLDRVCSSVVGEIERRQNAKLDILKQKPEFDKDLKNQLSDEFIQEIAEYLDGLESSVWASRARCLKRKNLCNWAPSIPKDEPGVLHLWFEVAGNTCTPWSARGKQMGWLDRMSVPALVWTWSLRNCERQPDVILNECTPRWPAEAFFQRVFSHAITETASFSPTDLGHSDRHW